MRMNAHFERLLPPGQEWFSPKEVAAVIGKTDQFVRDCFLNQKILGHTANGRAGLRHEKRQRYQIHREGVLLYLLRTANYEPEDFLAQVGELLSHCTPEEKRSLRRWLD
ncbi:hypothetical protein H5P28_08075 [Ruficoccus amylovorans]|uniref:DNA-binding protein n=1 Tax=Ruficoccus amylovorans TaxID=1804625 RepID=A0A842HDW2_9BACT|nr:hypothetical protein [Ruficoccus amylovorans]MBC2594218.1 hypothetical protein [Ruficoccus amylovorans]